jgi:A/G-specific adenine glycosylase
LAGLYELPNVEGNLGQEEVLSLVKELGYAPIRIQPLGDAKHIFSHIEWHMTGYAVRVEEPEMQPQVQSEKIGTDGLLFVDAEDAKEKYAIPSAFAAYAKYMNILLGSEKNR